MADKDHSWRRIGMKRKDGIACIWGFDGHKGFSRREKYVTEEGSVRIFLVLWI
jgi:hypothetical protein